MADKKFYYKGSSNRTEFFLNPLSQSDVIQQILTTWNRDCDPKLFFTFGI